MISELKNQISLRTVSLITTAKELWSSPDIKSKIDDLFLQGRISRVEDENHETRLEKFRRYTQRASGYNFWEDLTDDVLKKTDSFLLPGNVKQDLNMMIILMGQKLFSFYTMPNCSICSEAAGTRHFYMISPYGTDVYTCSSLHLLSNHPNVDSAKDEFFRNACLFCLENVVEFYQNEIIAMIQDIPAVGKRPLLNFNRKDVVFNILIVYHTLTDDYNRLLEAEEYLSDGDYIIPLKRLLGILENVTNNSSKKYFISKMRSLDLTIPVYYEQLNDNFLFLAEVFDNRMQPFRPYELEFYVTLANFMVRNDELSDETAQLMNDFIILFLPVWPFQQVFFKLLDVCHKNCLCLDFNFLLKFAVHCIGAQKRTRHPFHIEMFAKAFIKIWRMTPVKIRLDVMIWWEKAKMEANPHYRIPIHVRNHMTLLSEYWKEVVQGNKNEKYIEFDINWSEVSVKEFERFAGTWVNYKLGLIWGNHQV